MTVQLSTPYTDPERHNTHHHRQMDWIDDSIVPIANHTTQQQYDRLKIKQLKNGQH